jgi:hypothetical protein
MPPAGRSCSGAGPGGEQRLDRVGVEPVVRPACRDLAGRRRAAPAGFRPCRRGSRSSVEAVDHSGAETGKRKPEGRLDRAYSASSQRSCSERWLRVGCQAPSTRRKAYDRSNGIPPARATGVIYRNQRHRKPTTCGSSSRALRRPTPQREVALSPFGSFATSKLLSRDAAVKRSERERR